MKPFSEQLNAVVAKAKARQDRAFVTIFTETERSMVEGSEITGSPGQPVDTGYLKGSFQLEILSPRSAQVVTGVSYAPAIEDNTRSSFDPRGEDRPADMKSPSEGGGSQHIKSTVGGNHSRALTAAGMPQIVEHAWNEAKQAIP